MKTRMGYLCPCGRHYIYKLSLLLSPPSAQHQCDIERDLPPRLLSAEATFQPFLPRDSILHASHSWPDIETSEPPAPHGHRDSTADSNV